MSIKEEEYQRGLIITDDIAIDPILDFNLYTDAIVKIIKDSYPKFTIGLFGDWGTGKTTLMNSISAKLQNDNNSILVHFETWRYEREEQFVLIPLLKTIAFALPEQFQSLKQKLKRGAISFLKKTPDIVSSIISNHFKDAGIITEAAIDSFRKEFNSKLELLAEVDRDTLYFDGFEDIRRELKEIRQKNSAFRIVVFVDDLDRCSPTKTLEVLESIKVFLGMEGFIYVIGLSQDTVIKLIDIGYKESGVKGEQYIKKIIQIPITLPKWDNKDIIELIQNFIEKGLIHKDYKNIINGMDDLIATAVENNPREVKRCLNNFIVAYEIFHSTENFKANELLLIQAIQIRWNEFYNLLMISGAKFLGQLSKYSQMDEGTRSKILDSEEVKEDDEKENVLKTRKLLSKYKTDVELWDFLRKHSDTLKNIKDLTIYRRSVEVGTTYERRRSKNEEAYDLLRKGEIAEFNRRVTEFGILTLSEKDLNGASLSLANLSGADLSMADLTKANLSGANLSMADLTKANLSGANLSGASLARADLIKANLSGANLSGASLARADLSGADLAGARLIETNLSLANLSGADLSNSLIIHSELYENSKLDANTIISKAIIDDPHLVDYIRGFTNNVPETISNKKKLKIKLLEIIRDEKFVVELLSISKLPS